jgi:histone H3/H4
MATFSAAMVRVKDQLEQCLPKDCILRICRELGHKWRQRQSNPAISVQLLLLQLLASVALRGLRHVAGVSMSAQAICAARMRLPVQLFSRLIRHSLPGDFSQTATYKQFKTYIVDGMSFLVQDTRELAGKFGKASNQQGASRGYPTPKLLALMEAGAGFIAGGIILPYARQEFTCLSRLFKLLDPRSLLMGDRGLVSFTHMALLMARGLEGCFRLPRWQVVQGRGKGSRRLKKRLGRQDWLVAWTASRRPKWMSHKRWLAIAGQTLTLRQISFRVCRKGFRTNWAWIITTLVDPQKYPAQELIELYSQRWQIEVYFRDLKCTLKMRSISARTVKGVQKEVMAFILLYNLIRKVMQEAAQRQGVDPDRISFTDAALWLLHAPPGSELPELIVNPRRSRATQPREVKRGRRRFPLLKKPRAAACKPRCQVKI